MRVNFFKIAIALTAVIFFAATFAVFRPVWQARALLAAVREMPFDDHMAANLRESADRLGIKTYHGCAAGESCTVIFDNRLLHGLGLAPNTMFKVSAGNNLAGHKWLLIWYTIGSYPRFSGVITSYGFQPTYPQGGLRLDSRTGDNGLPRRVTVAHHSPVPYLQQIDFNLDCLRKIGGCESQQMAPAAWALYAEAERTGMFSRQACDTQEMSPLIKDSVGREVIREWKHVRELRETIRLDRATTAIITQSGCENFALQVVFEIGPDSVAANHTRVSTAAVLLKRLAPYCETELILAISRVLEKRVEELPEDEGIIDTDLPASAITVTEHNIGKKRRILLNYFFAL